MSFGHNDVARDERRYTDIDTYRRNLERFADDVASRGGNAVFASPTSCWEFDGDGNFKQRKYVTERASAMKAAAQAAGVVFVDMSELTARELQEKGKKDTRLYYMIQRIGNFDTMHTTRWGAKRFAELFVEYVRSTQSPFAKIFKPGKGKPVGKVKVDAVN